MSLEKEATKSGPLADVKGLVYEFIFSARVAKKENILSVFGRYGEERVDEALIDLALDGKILALCPLGFKSENLTPRNTYYIHNREI